MTVDVRTEREISYNCEQASLFEMVAEECSELSHVSSKIARYLRGDQPDKLERWIKRLNEKNKISEE